MSPLVGLWWGLWIGAAVLWWIAGPLIAMFSAWDEGPGYWIVRSLGQGLLLAAGVAAGLLVRRLDPQRFTPGGSAAAPTPAPSQAPVPLPAPLPAPLRAPVPGDGGGVPTWHPGQPGQPTPPWLDAVPLSLIHI